jgi:RND family efflux transporter MFP subunit
LQIHLKIMKKINILIVSLVIMSFISCGESSREVAEVPTVKVTLGGKSTHETGTFITASGKIEAENSANLSTRMMGFVNKVHVKVGQKVNAGQLLVSVNNTDLQAKKAQVDASIAQALSAFNSAKRDYERFQALYAQQSASPKELDDMTSRYEMAKAGLEGAQQMRNEVLAQFSYANITAPFGGVVINTFVKEGDMASPGIPLVSIEGASRLQVTAMVTESDIHKIQNGMEVTVHVKSLNKEVSGKVTEVSQSARNTGGLFLVKVTLYELNEKILPGMFANVQFQVEKNNEVLSEETRVLVPTNALVKKGQLTGIYTVAEGKAYLRWIRIGKTYGDQIEVLSGLSSKEPYIISAESKLFNGASVQTN